MLQNIIIGIAIFIFGFMGLMIGYKDHEISNSDKLIGEYQLQIDQLKADSEAQQERANQAQIEAQQQLENLQKEERDILSKKVPHDCDKAIQWAINEAKVIS